MLPLAWMNLHGNYGDFDKMAKKRPKIRWLRCFVKKEHLINHKRKELTELIAFGDGNLLEQAVSVLYSLFDSSELSIFDMEHGKLLATTALNDDVKVAIHSLLSRESRLKEPLYVRMGDSHLFRTGVKQMEIIPLGRDGRFCLCAESYSYKSFPDDDHMQEIYMLLSIISEIQAIKEYASMVSQIDRRTQLQNRDALMERMLKLFENTAYKDMCLGIICLSNVAELNKTYGIDTVDEFLLRMASGIGKSVQGGAYRIGGTKFAVLIRGELYASAAKLESLVDHLHDINRHIVISAVITSLYEDAYKSMYICESHLKTAEQDVVTVVRDAADKEFLKEFEKVTETYTVNDLRECVEEVEKEQPYYGDEGVEIPFPEWKQHRESVENEPSEDKKVEGGGERSEKTNPEAQEPEEPLQYTFDELCKMV